MHRIILSILVPFAIINTQAQTAEPKSQFSVALVQGVNRSNIDKTAGTKLHFEPSFASNHSLQFRYRYRFNPKWYAELGLGAGIQGFNEKNPLYNDYSLWSYQVFAQSRTEFQAAYTLFSKGNKSINLPFGFGWNRLGSVLSESSSSGPTGNTKLRTETNSKIKPYVLLGGEYQVQTKRKDYVSLQLFYQYGFQNAISGNYVSWGNDISSSGNVHQTSRGVYFGMAYTFSQIQRKERIAELKQSGELNDREARKSRKKEKRYIDPKSTYLSLGIGWASAQNTVKTKNTPFKNGGFASMQPRIALEKGIQNGFFWEAEYNFFEFWNVISSKNEIGTMGSNAFFGHFIQGGFGYRIQNKQTLFQFFNVHAGLGLGTHFAPDSYLSNQTVTISDTNNIVKAQITDSSYIVGKLMPIGYLGISKDIRLTEKLTLSLQFKQQLGINAALRSDKTYISATNPTPISGYSVLNGTARSFQIGLKYLIRPKELSKLE